MVRKVFIAHEWICFLAAPQCVSDWHHHTNVQKGLGQTGAQVDVRVELTMSPHRMEIPIPPDRCFCGRETSVKDVTDALLAREGARVLITGVAGMGKDALAAAVLRSERGSCNKDFCVCWLGDLYQCSI